MPSRQFFEALAAQSTSEAPALLLTLTHADFDAPIRLTDARFDIVSTAPALLIGAETAAVFGAWAMQAPLPSDGPEPAGRGARLVLDNTDKWLGGQLSLSKTRPRARIDVVLVGAPDDIQVSWPGLRLYSWAPGAGVVELDLRARDDSEETFPYQTFSPRRTKGLYV